MKGQKRRGVLYAMALLCLLLLVGCSDIYEVTGEEPEGQGKTARELPEDTPWNHGYHAIMETEAGYYTNQSTMCLRYYDKASGQSILLCNKPECEHKGGDTCEATYRGIKTINSLMYKGSIYVLGMDENQSEVSINLYKAALDGSAIDKVGCVISAENAKKEEITIRQTEMIDMGFHDKPDYSFIIHKGYAYIPYLLRFGKGSMGLKGGGLVKMDLKTGETQELYSIKYLAEGVPGRLSGVGDYVYFRVYGNYSGSSVKRYVISTDQVEDVYGTNPGMPDDKINLNAYVFGADRIYGFQTRREGEKEFLEVVTMDAATGEFLPEERIQTEMEYSPYTLRAAFLYDNKLFLADDTHGCWYDRQGAKVAEIAFPEELAGTRLQVNPWERNDYSMEYKVNDGKLYLMFSDASDDFYATEYMYRRMKVFSCDLKELFEGRGEWKEAFVTE